MNKTKISVRLRNRLITAIDSAIKPKLVHNTKQFFFTATGVKAKAIGLSEL